MTLLIYVKKKILNFLLRWLQSRVELRAQLESFKTERRAAERRGDRQTAMKIEEKMAEVVANIQHVQNNIKECQVNNFEKVQNNIKECQVNNVQQVQNDIRGC